MNDSLKLAVANIAEGVRQEIDLELNKLAKLVQIILDSGIRAKEFEIETCYGKITGVRFNYGQKRYRVGTDFCVETVGDGILTCDENAYKLKKRLKI